MTAIRVKRSSDGAAVMARSRSCIACSNCRLSEGLLEQDLDLEEFEWSLAPSDHYRLMWNSLGKPMVGLIIAALLNDLYSLNDSASIAMVVIGLILGSLSCRALPETVLEEKRVC